MAVVELIKTIVNKSTGKVVFSRSGQTITAFLSFTDASSGLTASHNTSGGWEVNTFTIPDTTRPTLTITAPVANQRWSNDVFTVTGKASDNVAVANVQLSQDGVNWTDLGNSTNWSSDISLTPGPNTVLAYAIDTVRPRRQTDDR